ncbi:hypothetical protein [Trinickia sp. Y13]|uniref:hypothetical protein n=1 Tax=Trinickia sp. Y13 TaxID=2917807 RepID=UPI002404EC6D|nr:hypothetical protein [Trinickia sp. Y13]MDG0024942.1 hypothetical protein [Trinickia sp. Y13]
MELATKRSNANAKADLRALVNGQYVGDANALIEKVAADLLAGVSARIEAKSRTGEVAGLTSGVARRAIASRLAKWLIRDNGRGGVARAACLPVARWSPEEVIEHTGMSKSTLYRGDHAQFYSVVPPGKKNGRAYPAWQFVAEVPSHLPQLLEVLRSNSRMQVNTFFMSEQDSLNELSPAEVLAGMPFEHRRTLAPEQARMLSLPIKVRLNKINALAKMEVADLD